jgi:hypothetical protein
VRAVYFTDDLGAAPVRLSAPPLDILLIHTASEPCVRNPQDAAQFRAKKSKKDTPGTPIRTTPNQEDSVRGLTTRKRRNIEVSEDSDSDPEWDQRESLRKVARYLRMAADEIDLLRKQSRK